MYGSSQNVIDNLLRQKDRIDDMIKNYQQPQPVNNFINTNQVQDNTYEMKKLNENDEVENIAIFKDTIFIGEDRLQIKKLDGTIEKYEIKKVYPRDKKDDKIDELTKKIQELEMKLNEPTKSSKSVGECNKSYGTDDVNVEPKSKTSSKSVSK